MTLYIHTKEEDFVRIQEEEELLDSTGGFAEKHISDTPWELENE